MTFDIEKTLSSLDEALTSRIDFLDRVSAEIRRIEEYLNDKHAPEFFHSKTGLSFEKRGQRRRVTYAREGIVKTLQEWRAEIRIEGHEKLPEFLQALGNFAKAGILLTAEQREDARAWQKAMEL